MINRRRFGALLAGAAAIPIAPKSARSQQVTGKPVYYSGVGPELTLYEIDVADGFAEPPERAAIRGVADPGHVRGQLDHLLAHFVRALQGGAVG